jgi:hypothetical protein
MLRIGLLDSGQGRLLMQLGGRLLQPSNGMLEKAAGGEFERVAVRFLAALQKALPSLSRQEIAWRMNFTIGAAARALSGGIPVKVLSRASHENLQERDVQRVLQRRKHMGNLGGLGVLLIDQVGQVSRAVQDQYSLH